MRIGDRYRDADNAKGLHRTLRVTALRAYTAQCHEEGSDRHPEIGLAALADDTLFELIETAA